MKKPNIKIFLLVLILGILFFSFFQDTQKIKAGGEHNVSGWAWAENVGWISFNSTNCDADEDGSSDGTAGCPLVGEPVANYGVNIATTTGIFSGYAWSENVGWISFNESELSGCPTSTCRAWVDLSCPGDQCLVYGWAKALVGGTPESGGWDGWIKLRGFIDTNGNGVKDAGEEDYGVWIDPHASPAEFKDWAWSDMVIGWMSFNCDNCEGTVCDSYPTCGDPAHPDYKVETSFAFSPEVSGTNDSFIDPCAQSRIPNLSWVTDADKPYDYEIQIDNDSGFGSPEVTDTVLSTHSTSWGPGCSKCCPGAPYDSIAWGGNVYYWQVRTRNIGGMWSDWEKDPDGFITYEHCWPSPDFLCNGANCSALRISEEEIVTLTDNSKIWGGATTTNCSWNLPSGSTVIEGDPLFSCELAVEFEAGRNQGITLTVTDSTGYSCPYTEFIDVSIPLPEWKEIAPF